MPRDPDTKALFDALAEPFDPRDVKFKPQMVKNNRCLAMAYIDARIVQDRLDDVAGPENWTESYHVLPEGSVICTLTVCGVSKQDVGSLSEQPDAGDKLKAAFSDALKRAAVKFGIGRYLYRLPASWVDYDPTKKQITSPPRLPDWALPRGEPQRPVQNPTPPASSAVQEALKEWRGKMAGVGAAQDLNDLIPLLKKVKPPEAKQAVWELFGEQAADRGYEYDAKRQEYFEPQQQEEEGPIPF